VRVAVRIWLAGARQRRLYVLTAGGDDAPIEAVDCNLVSRLGDGVSAFRVERGRDVAQELVSDFLGLHVAAVVDELLDRNAAGKLRHRAEMIAVPVRR